MMKCRDRVLSFNRGLDCTSLGYTKYAGSGNYPYGYSWRAPNAAQYRTYGYPDELALAIYQSYADRETYPYTLKSYEAQGFQHFCSTSYCKPISNDCLNRKQVSVNLPFQVNTRANFNANASSYWLYYRRVNQFLIPPDAVETHPPIDLRNARATAWHTMQPEFEGNISLINFLFELKDFKSIAKYLAKKPLKKLANFARRHWSSNTAKKTIRSGTRLAAEARLTNEYAIKPLIKDIVTLHIQLKETVSELQKQFAAEGLAGNTRHYSEDFIHTETLGSSVYSYPVASGYKYSTKFTANMRYTYQYETRTFIDAIVKYYGLGLSFEAIWNGIPFSFLADYLINIGKTISIMEHDPNVLLKCGEYTESLLTAREYGSFLVPGRYNTLEAPIVDGFIRSKTKSCLVAGSSASLYTRQRTTPYYGPVSPRLRKPSSGQMLNVAALVRCIL